MSLVLAGVMPRAPYQSARTSDTAFHRAPNLSAWGGSRYGIAMLAMHPDCQRCGADLPPQAGGAFICSFECTFCAACAEALDDRCPNCGGELVDRPTRTGKGPRDHPAATRRRFAS